MKIKAILFAVLAGLSASSYAENCTLEECSGIYAGVSYGSANASGLDTLTYPVRRATSLSAFIGSRVSESFAVEAGYVKLGSYQAVAVAPAIPQTSEVDLISISGVYSVPVFRDDMIDLSIYAKLGLSMATVRNNLIAGPNKQNTDSVTFGFGLEGNLTRETGLRIGFDSYRIGDIWPVTPAIAPATTTSNGTNSQITVVGLSAFYNF